jgi:hypothetical protein
MGQVGGGVERGQTYFITRIDVRLDGSKYTASFSRKSPGRNRHKFR